MNTYKKSRSSTKKPSRSRKTVIVLCIGLILAAGALAYEVNRQGTDQKIPTATSDTAPKTTKKSDDSHKEVNTSTFNQGGAKDTSGAVTPTTVETDPAKWTTSTSGAITLQQPTANTALASGDTIRGTAQTGSVQYRLVDSTAGVISQGTLNVVAGKFSGIIEFKAYSTKGSLKVFSTDPQSGVETNHADITVTMSP